MTWKIAWTAWLAKPIFGWGHEAFYAAFNKFYNPEFIKFSFAETWFDKSHNIFLDLLSMTGVLGLVSYLALFIMGFLALARLGKSGEVHKTLLPLYISFVAVYFVSNFFEFDTPSSLLGIFFVFALINSYIKKGKTQDIVVAVKNEQTDKTKTTNIKKDSGKDR